MNKPTINSWVASQTAEPSQSTHCTGRRTILRDASLTAAAMLLPEAKAVLAQAQPQKSPAPVNSPDYRIEIAEIEWELSPRKKIRTAAYNGRIPGQVLRVTEGTPVSIEIANRLGRAEIAHWHGQWTPGLQITGL